MGLSLHLPPKYPQSWGLEASYIRSRIGVISLITDLLLPNDVAVAKLFNFYPFTF